tara:strand:+ start:3398 stop:4186 length:789 start_codon:yes stop_codon:yes gene_type:complete
MEKKYLHTIEDNIVKDVYSAISNHSQDNQYFAGGMSTQFFLPKDLHRESSDIDMNGTLKYSFSEFEDSVHDGLEELLDKGYKKSKKKQRATFDINLENDEELIILQYPRKSSGSYPWLKKVGERENANAQKMTYNGGFLRIIPTEDIILHKTLRINSFKENYNINSEKPSSMSLNSLQNSINSLKKDYIINQFNLEPKDANRAISKIRLYADIFDIKALSTYKGLDKKYFLEGLKDYKRLKPKKDKLLNWLYSINPNVFGGE